MGEERDRLVDEVQAEMQEEVDAEVDAEAQAEAQEIENEVRKEQEDGPAETEQRPTLDRGRYIPTKEAVELLGVNRATVINWARQGKFGGFQYGVRGIYRFDRQELLDFIGRSRIPYPQGAENLSGDDAGL